MELPDVAPVLVLASKQGEEIVRFYSLGGSSICKWQNGQGDYVTYHIMARRYPEEEGAFLESTLEVCLHMIG